MWISAMAHACKRRAIVNSAARHGTSGHHMVNACMAFAADRELYLVSARPLTYPECQTM